MSLDVAFSQVFPGITLDIAFSVPGTGVTALFGPSRAAGKSTVIAAAAGLLRPPRCRVALDGAVLADTATGQFLPPERRRVGLVFQEARLFPHMSVATNLRYGRAACPAGAGAGSMRWWSCSALRPCSAAARGPCRAAKGSVWRLAAPCWPSRCCC